MTYQYDFSESGISTPSGEPMPQPSEQAVKTILGFAKSYQAIEAGGITIDVYLN